MNPNLTEIVCVIDMSSAMRPLAKSLIAAYNAFTKEQESLPGVELLTLTLFADRPHTRYRATALDALPELSDLEYDPAGGRCLFDALSQTLDEVHRRWAATPESARAHRGIVIVLTAAQDTASRYHDQESAKAAVAQLRASGWHCFGAGAGDRGVASLEAVLGDAVTLLFPLSAAGVRMVWQDLRGMVSDVRRG